MDTNFDAQFHELLVYAVVIIITYFFLLWWCINSKWWLMKKKKLPPSPRKLPIIGNLHQVGTLPHRNLEILSRKHGPVMLLHLGSVPTLVVSSAAGAREIMRTHDTDFADRLQITALKKFFYDCKDVAIAPYGEYWRQMKGIFVQKLLSHKRVQSFRYIREEETTLLVKKIEESNGRPVNLSGMLSELAIDVICRSAFGIKYCSDSEIGKRFLSLLADVMELIGAVSVGDFIPWLRWINCLNGYDKRVDRVAKQVDVILESVIQDNVANPTAQVNGETFVQILLQIYNEQTADDASSSFDRLSIKGLVMDAFIAGTDTVSTAMEWLMTELLRHPNVMEKLQNEVREIVGGKGGDITDEDLAKMNYMKAVIKETLRCHPPTPMLLPKLASKDVKIMGYDVSKGTVVMVNAWAIGRDPQSWDEPEKFEPERFLNNSNLDFKSLDFEMLPFGAGRRGCPGISFALANLEFVVANLMHKFNWELPDGLLGKDLDMTESTGFTTHRAIPLLALATRI
ncbi:hypothetical protein ABFS83_04G182300 [Erythranthe nasuta]